MGVAKTRKAPFVLWFWDSTSIHTLTKIFHHSKNQPHQNPPNLYPKIAPKLFHHPIKPVKIRHFCEIVTFIELSQ